MFYVPRFTKITSMDAPRGASVTASSSMRRVARTGCLLLGGLLSAAVSSAEPLTVAYAHRPGYADMIEGVPKGISIEIAYKAVQAAKLDVSWALMVQPRQMAMFQQSAPNFCAIGLFKTPERVAYAQFSHPYYRDRRFVVVASRAAGPELHRKPTFAQLLEDRRLELGLLDSLSYGSQIDEMLRARGGVTKVEGRIEQVFKMVASGRIDYTLASPEEVEPIMAMAGVTHEQVDILSYPDFPEGNLRYFICSKAVDKGVIKQLNKGIAALNIHLNE